MAFHVGQKVVCVNDRLHYPPGSAVHGYDGIVRLTKGTLDGLKRGATYTVRAMGVDWMTGEPSLYLREIVRGIDSDGEESGFRASRFRPVVEPKTDISIFTAMLKPKKATAPA